MRARPNLACAPMFMRRASAFWLYVPFLHTCLAWLHACVCDLAPSPPPPPPPAAAARRRPQERAFLVTNRAIYNIMPGDFSRCARAPCFVPELCAVYAWVRGLFARACACTCARARVQRGPARLFPRALPLLRARACRASTGRPASPLAAVCLCLRACVPAAAHAAAPAQVQAAGAVLCDRGDHDVERLRRVRAAHPEARNTRAGHVPFHVTRLAYARPSH
jgi:hypothetical protein